MSSSDVAAQPPDVEQRLAELEAYLKRCRTISGPQRSKTAFIANVMKRVRAIAEEASYGASGIPGRPGPVPVQPETQPKTKPWGLDRLVPVKAKNLPLGPGGAVQMTPSESMRADEELGHSPFTKKGSNDER